MFWGVQTLLVDLKINALAPNKRVKPKEMFFLPFLKSE